MDIQKSYFLPVQVETVFKAWVSSDTVIAPAQKMNIDPQVGGVYQLFMSAEASEPSNSGQFLVFEKNCRVVYTWEWHKDGEVTEIAVDFGPEADGTRINLSHTGFIHQKSCEMHDSGWDNYITGFAAYLGVSEC